MAIPVTNVVSGARALFQITPKGSSPITVGFASGVNGAEEVVYEPVEVLNRLEVREWVPVSYRVTLSASMFRTFQDTREGTGSLKKQGLFPKRISNILAFEPMTAALIDNTVNKNIMKFEQIQITSYNFSVTARGLIGQDVNFVCVRASDEGTTS